MRHLPSLKILHFYSYALKITKSKIYKSVCRCHEADISVQTVAQAGFLPVLVVSMLSQADELLTVAHPSLSFLVELWTRK